ncbi:MAG: MBL fold metallo-hydrolase [Clostridium sp.]|uniref:ComEC/Rec2 family competence protein n=1 Tax=Clostridium sp. TaxID=1506 RepID=UPI0025BEE72B|nr:MBL fold metallo-hydrolase [Clostridium sp.]MCH3965929.1 MBL fold metallo-hydrolase [Clostridium sp.]MCI1715982.1 MBL fold metallo-hydrolase [Clostridium sp.]MCI1800346.1 MBL fold metallo-hydrolase [Clostridium sp.]MCI1814159.1 MBL fold metallo-hydrolase [Clostridium sp.]MCI1871058.1 MBL fold metallo-hydrolase [Clostridium sp.]
MKNRLIFIFTFILIMCISMFNWNITYANLGGPEVHFLYTGQSDCILVKTGNKNYLIDTGQAYYTKRILRYLNLNKVGRLNGIIITHYHDDHYGGLIKIAKSVEVSRIYLPNNKNDIKHVLSRSLSKLNIPVEYIDKGWSINSPKLHLKAIAPVIKNKKTSNSNSDENNNSIVLQGKIGGISYLFAGDCEKREENDMIESGLLKECDILKVPHHGINTSTDSTLLGMIKPKAAVITSNGRTPNASVIKRLLKNNVIVLRTDHQGDVIVRNRSIFCDRSNIKIKFR